MPLSSYSYNLATAALTPVLAGFPGKIVAIDGRTGSGKTTLGRYLAWHLNVSLLETDLLLMGGQGFTYHLDHLTRMIVQRIEQPRPVIVEGVAIRWLLDSVQTLRSAVSIAVQPAATRRSTMSLPRNPSTAQMKLQI